MSSEFLVLDLETTGREPETAHVVEWAIVWCDRIGPFRHGRVGLVRPPVPIPPETSAVHHIIDRDVETAPAWTAASGEIRRIIAVNRPVALVAHNAEFERHFLAELAPGIPWICTYKAALRVWPEAPSHSNEALRYWLGLPDLGREYQQEPHSAYHDAEVTGYLLQRLLERASVEDLIRWADEPALLPRCPIGQYRNLAWADVPTDFLEWILYKAVDMRRDVAHSARLELTRRYQVVDVAADDEEDDHGDR